MKHSRFSQTHEIGTIAKFEIPLLNNVKFYVVIGIKIMKWFFFFSAYMRQKILCVHSFTKKIQ